MAHTRTAAITILLSTTRRGRKPKGSRMIFWLVVDGCLINVGQGLVDGKSVGNGWWLLIVTHGCR